MERDERVETVSLKGKRRGAFRPKREFVEPVTGISNPECS